MFEQQNQFLEVDFESQIQPLQVQEELKNSDDQLTQEIQQQVLDFFNNCKLSDNSDNELDDKDPQQVGQLLELDELPNSSLLPLNFNLDGIEEDSDDSLSFESLTFHNNPFGAVIIPNQKFTDDQSQRTNHESNRSYEHRDQPLNFELQSN